MRQNNIRTLKKVISAVLHLETRRGVKMSKIKGYLWQNYRVVEPNLKKFLRIAVKEKFLTIKNHRYFALPNTYNLTISPEYAEKWYSLRKREYL